MIVSFGDKRLRMLWQGSRKHGIQEDIVERVIDCLNALHLMTDPRKLPGRMRWKPYAGEKDRWQVMVTGTWRIRLLWDGKDCHDVILRNDH